MAPIKAWIIPIDEPPSGRPPGIWGGANEPFPTPPIYYPPGGAGGRPPGIWGGANEPFPTPPMVIPPDTPGLWPPPNPAHPAHPIVVPPSPLPPEIPKPPGGETGSPENPINLPPTAIASTHGFWALCYFAEMGGWLWAWVPVDVAKPAKR